MSSIYEPIISFKLSKPHNISNSDVVKCGGSGKYHIELAIGKRGDGEYTASRLSICPFFE